MAAWQDGARVAAWIPPPPQVPAVSLLSGLIIEHMQSKRDSWGKKYIPPNQIFLAFPLTAVLSAAESGVRIVLVS